MSRAWLMVIPALSPLAILLVMYVIHVAPRTFRSVHAYDTFSQRFVWASEYWWRRMSSEPDYTLAICVLGFLAGSILALLLHLFLPRPAGREDQPPS